MMHGFGSGLVLHRGQRVELRLLLNIHLCTHLLSTQTDPAMATSQTKDLREWYPLESSPEVFSKMARVGPCRHRLPSTSLTETVAFLNHADTYSLGACPINTTSSTFLALTQNSSPWSIAPSTLSFYFSRTLATSSRCGLRKDHAWTCRRARRLSGYRRWV